ncbi:hypothetical protein IWX92DRAFT_380148 [Phyllosticta citricarpa]
MRRRQRAAVRVKRRRPTTIYSLVVLGWLAFFRDVNAQGTADGCLSVCLTVCVSVGVGSTLFHISFSLHLSDHQPRACRRYSVRLGKPVSFCGLQSPIHDKNKCNWPSCLSCCFRLTIVSSPHPRPRPVINDCARFAPGLMDPLSTIKLFDSVGSAKNSTLQPGTGLCCEKTVSSGRLDGLDSDSRAPLVTPLHARLNHLHPSQGLTRGGGSVGEQ